MAKTCQRCGTPYEFTHRGQRFCSFACRFWAKVAVGSEDECWPWIGARNSGYGEVSVDRRPQLAHRVSWALASGADAGDLLVLHECDNPPCCNPKHLYLGTLGDNVQDMWNRNRRATSRWREIATQTSSIRGSKKLGAADVVWMRERYASGSMNTHELAEALSVNDSVISRTVRGEAYPDVAGPIAKKQRRMTNDDKRRIREMAAAEISLSEIAAATGFTKTAIRFLINGRRAL